MLLNECTWKRDINNLNLSELQNQIINSIENLDHKLFFDLGG